MTDKAVELEISKKDLNEKLSSALSECNAKDDLVTKHAKVAEEAIAGYCTTTVFFFPHTSLVMIYCFSVCRFDDHVFILSFSVI